MGASGIMAAGFGLQGVSSLVGGINQANAAKMNADYQANMLRENAKLSELQGQDAIRRGDFEAAQIGERTKQAIGSERAGYASQNIDVNSGSAAQVQSDTQYLGALDALTAKNNAWREAWGYKVQSMSDENQAAFDELAGQAAYNNTLLTGGLNFFSSGLKGGYYLAGGK